MIDGQAIALTDLNSVTTAGNGYDVSVSAPGSIAYVTITRVGGFSAAAAEALVDGLAYDNASEAPQGAAHMVTLGLIQDDGGTANGGQNTTAYNLDSLVTIVAVNDAPVITSGGGGAAAALNVTENATAVTTVTATDPEGDTPTFSISGGADAGLFDIDTNTGVLTFNVASDFENPTDSNSDNVYVVEVAASDGQGGMGVQLISVTINNADPTAVDDAYAVDADATLDVDWWDTDWTRRQQLTFDNLAQSETLTDVPVLIVLNSGNVNYAQTKNDGSDLRFFAADGTALAYEIEQWNEAGDSSVWVRMPQITGNSSSDSIWMYYGNAAAESIAQPGAVWDSNFVGVWHLNEEQAGAGTDGVYADSTSLGNDGIDHVAAVGQEGQVTDGQEFGANDWVEIDHDPSLDLKDSMTISFWIKPTSDSGNFNRVVEKGLWGYGSSYYFGGGDGTNDLTFYLNGQEVIDTADNVLTVGVWQQATVSYTSNGDGTGSAKLYLNGAEIASGNYTNGVVVGNTGRLAIGHDDPLYDFDGFIDEVQISNTDRSADWIAAQYQATKNQFGAEFVQFNGEESAPALGGVLTNDLPDGTPAISVTNLNTAGTLGLVTLNQDGTFSYDPNGQFDYLAAGATATDTFTYDITESNGATSTATVTITITGINDTPTITANTGLTVDEGDLGTVLTTAMLNEGDPDDDGVELTYTVTSVPTFGTLRLSGAALINGSTFTQDDIDNNRVTYDHDDSENFTDSFDFSLADGGENGATPVTGTFNITITPVNDNDPVADDESFTVLEGGTATEADLAVGTSLTGRRYRCRPAQRHADGQYDPGGWAELRSPDPERQRHLQLHP